MANGSMRIVVENYDQLVPLAQRVLCWAGADRLTIRTDTQGPVLAIVIPEATMSGKGALNLRRGGADVLSGYVAGSNAVYYASNALGAMSQTPAYTCPASTNQPTFSSVTMNVGGDPKAITLTYANVTSSGTVNIDWGDGSTTAGAAESGTANHTYAQFGTYRITITDASSATDTGFLVVNLPTQ